MLANSITHLTSGTSTAALDEPRKAFVIAASEGYLPGLVATLNGLDYHGNNMDVYWIYHDEGKGEIAAAEHLMNLIPDAGLCYNTYAVPMSALMEEWPEGAERSRGWKFRFYKYPFMLSLADRYDVTGALSGDTVVLDHIEPWWDMMANTKYLLTTNHSFAGRGHILQLTAETAGSQTCMTDIPLIFDPAKWGDVFHSLWERACDTEAAASELKALNWAVWHQGRGRDVVYSAECQWVTHHLWYLNIHRVNVAGKYMFCGDDKIRYWIYTVHGKWAPYSNCKAKASTGNKTLASNVWKLHNEYRRLITDHKLKPGYEDSSRWAEELRPHG